MPSRDEEFFYRCDQVRHWTVLKPGSISVRQSYIRFPPMTQVTVRIIVNFNVPEKGLIKYSPWASSITFVKNAQWRLLAVKLLICREFRKALHFHIVDLRQIFP